jgi:hypothetical protein
MVSDLRALPPHPERELAEVDRSGAGLLDAVVALGGRAFE